ncbi:MAG TPA: N-acetylglucosamine-6-phosphate deacetylase [Chitinophagaceae bacterium]|nr:N-acetylglucosamine-6-phosphate deacetylase [Chitinophagaceae bacterium]
MSDRLKIYNGKVITPGRIMPNGTVVMSGEKISEVSDGNIDVPGATEIDAKGNYVSPGFIDIHIHGGGGYDFMDGTVEAFLEIAKLHARYGTTSMLPTTLTSGKQRLLQTLAAYERANAQNRLGARFLGMHIEGPYISMNQKGAQDPRFIRDPDEKEYEEIVSGYSNNINRWSAAPELKGALKFGSYLRSNGILPSIAHTDATYNEVVEAFKSGYTHLTHFYSAMSGVTRVGCSRYAGVIESGYLIDEMTVEIIADGVHLPEPLLQLVYKIKGAKRTALITDAIRATGTSARETILGDLENGVSVIVEDDVAKLPDRSCFAGSVATADRLVRTMLNVAKVPLLETIQMITDTPAAIIGVDDKKGSLARGKDADVIIFDDKITVQTTIIKGKVVYDRNDKGKNY